MLKSWKTWLAVLIGLLLIAALSLFLGVQGFGSASNVLLLISLVLIAAWVFVGLFVWREMPWIRRLGAVAIGTTIAAFVILIAYRFNFTGTAIAAIGVYAMAMAFYLGLIGLRLILSPGYAFIGVARTLLDEAIRMKVPLIFVVILVVMVPLLPILINPDDFLKYRIESFLTYSMFIVSVMLSLMTVFLAVGTVTKEIQEKQIFTTMSKPVSRFEYLLGKWLGITLMNLLLVLVCGIAIYVFTMMLSQSEARDYEDRIAVDHRVLVARVSERPKPPGDGDLQRMFAQRLERLRFDDPETYGQPGSPIESLDPGLRAEIQQRVIATWYSIGPRDTQSYQFTGLAKAKEYGQAIQLRIKPKAGSKTEDGFVYLQLRINDRDDPQGFRKLIDNKYSTIDIRSDVIGDDGVLSIGVTNPPLQNSLTGDLIDQPSIAFGSGDGIEVFYKVGSFEGNLVRSMFIVWLRLGFLAMLGLAAGTFLSFPIACLVGLLIYIAAAASGYLNESLAQYSSFPSETLPLWDRIVGVPNKVIDKFGQGEYWDGIKVFIRLIGSGFMLLIPSFATYNPTPLLSDGRLVSGRMVGQATIWIGIIWTATVGIIGYIIFRTRELARVTV